MKKLNPLFLLSLFFSLILISGTARSDSLKDVERDMDRLDREVEKVKRSLEKISGTVISPEASRVKFYIDGLTPSNLSGSLDIFLNGELEGKIILEQVKKGKASPARSPVSDSYFLPGKYRVKVKGTLNGVEVEGESKSILDLKPGETSKVVIKAKRKVKSIVITIE